jgi:hypothetical protein
VEGMKGFFIVSRGSDPVENRFGKLAGQVSLTVDLLEERAVKLRL